MALAKMKQGKKEAAEEKEKEKEKAEVEKARNNY